MSFRPSKAYKMSRDGVILSEVNPNGQVTLNNDEIMLLVYNTSTLARYGPANKPVFTINLNRIPSADFVTVGFYNAKVTGEVKIGSKITSNRTNTAEYSVIKRSGQEPTYAQNTYDIYATGNYVYFEVRKSAANGSVMPADQVFTISGFDLSFTSGATNPFVASSNFAGGYKNQNRPFTISLSATQYSNSITQYSVAGGTFYYKKTSASTYNSIAFSGSSVTVPAGTLEAGETYNIYFTARANTGATANCGTATITTVDAAAVVTAVSPSNEVTHGSTTFMWNYSSEYGEAQHAFDLQISTDNSTWTTIQSHNVTSSTSYHYDGLDTAGTIYWRVRGYNQSDTAGSWSASKSFINRVPPAAPTIINIAIAGRVTVQWVAAVQTAYRMQILQNDGVVYDSGDIYGSESQSRAETYLKNGGYTARVRIFDQYGQESPWGVMDFTQTAELSALEYTAVYDPMRNGVVLAITSEGFEKYYFEREGMLIAKSTEPEYLDMYASGPTTYRLIAVDENDDFAQAEFTINVRIQSSRLITLDGRVLEVSERWENYNNATQTETAKFSALEFFGASAPSHVFAKMRTKRISQAFYDPERISEELLGKIAFYGDIYGNADYVAITSRSRSDTWFGDETVLEMELTSWKAGIKYD